MLLSREMVVPPADSRVNWASVRGSDWSCSSISDRALDVRVLDLGKRCNFVRAYMYKGRDVKLLRRG